MAPAISDFEAKGWYLTEEGLDSLKSKVDDENASLDDYIEHAKDVNKIKNKNNKNTGWNNLVLDGFTYLEQQGDAKDSRYQSSASQRGTPSA